MADRQLAAQRLLIEAAELSYDGELDIDWDREPESGLPWLPENLVSLFGTRLWRSLSSGQRMDLGRRELVDLLTVSMYLETAAAMLTFRSVAMEQSFGEDRARFQLSIVKERSRDVTMFSRLINRTGVDPYLRKRNSDRMARWALMSPVGPFSTMVSLMADELVDVLSGAIAESGQIQPHIRQVMAVHSVARGRHIEYNWAELGDQVAAMAVGRRRIHAVLAAIAIVRLGPVLVNGDIYRDVGIRRYRALLSAYTSGQYRRRMRSLTGILVAVGMETGLFADAVSLSILRLGRCEPSSPPKF